MTTASFTLGNSPLGVTQFAALARAIPGSLLFGEQARQKITAANQFLLQSQAAGTPIYGLTTGQRGD